MAAHETNESFLISFKIAILTNNNTILLFIFYYTTLHKNTSIAQFSQKRFIQRPKNVWMQLFCLEFHKARICT